MTRYLRPDSSEVARRSSARAQHVQRDGQQLQPDEEHDQVLRAGQHHHAGDRGEQQRVVFARAGLAHRGGADGQQHGEQPGDVEEHRHPDGEGVRRQGADHGGRLVARLPDPDAQADGREQRDRGERRDHHALHGAAAHQADHEHHDRAAQHRHQRRQRLVVDLGGGDVGEGDDHGWISGWAFGSTGTCWLGSCGTWLGSDRDLLARVLRHLARVLGYLAGVDRTCCCGTCCWAAAGGAASASPPSSASSPAACTLETVASSERSRSSCG